MMLYSDMLGLTDKFWLTFWFCSFDLLFLRRTSTSTTRPENIKKEDEIDMSLFCIFCPQNVCVQCPSIEYCTIVQYSPPSFAHSKAPKRRRDKQMASHGIGINIYYIFLGCCSHIGTGHQLRLQIIVYLLSYAVL